jgi:hypothetical protein
VDFKTICSNGTGGFIVVAPSKNKEWIKSFNDIDYLPIISDDLLNYVAKPTHNRTTMTINFAETGESIFIEDSWVLARFAIVGMFEEFQEMNIPIGTLSEFKALMDVMEDSDLSLRDVPNRRAFVERMCTLADFLGIRVADFTALRTKWMESVRLYDVHPEMAEALEEIEPILLTDEIVENTFYKRKDFGQDAIFPRFETHDRPRHPLMDMVFVAEEIPRDVLELLQMFPEEIVIAGGFATGCLLRDVEAGNDIDLFVVGTEERAQMIMEYIIREIQTTGRGTYRTGNAVTFLSSMDTDEIPIQVILKLHNKKSDVIQGFDIEPSKALIFAGRSGELEAMVTQGWLECARTYSFPILARTWSSSSTYRIIKYGAKGFQPYLCGVRQELRQIDYDGIHATQRVHDDLVEAITQCMGVKEILCAEIFYRHQNRVGYYATLTPTTMTCMTSLFRGIRRSDYMCIGWGVAYWRRLTRFAFNCMVRMGIRDRRAFGSFVALDPSNCTEILMWKPAAGNRVHNCFYKADSNLDGVVNE